MALTKHKVQSIKTGKIYNFLQDDKGNSFFYSNTPLQSKTGKAIFEENFRKFQKVSGFNLERGMGE